MPQVKQPYSNTADWHGVSRRTVWHWIEEGMPHVKDGMPRTPVRVNTVEADNWLFQPRLNKVVPKSDSTTLEAERKRVIKAQADREELENEKRRGELIYFSAALNIITSIASLVASRLKVSLADLRTTW